MRKLIMGPPTGARRLSFVGDQIKFSLSAEGTLALPGGWKAFLRTNLGGASLQRAETIRSHFKRSPLAGAAWQNIPLNAGENEWRVELTLTEVGFFRAKAYALDPEGRQHWPVGPDVGVTVHPDRYRTANTIYCAFVRLLGASKRSTGTKPGKLKTQLKSLDDQGYTVIPPSGKIRELILELPHIFDTLGYRILHLLPVSPTPTTFARFGRFGSPYAVQDLAAIDPSLVEFDRRTTGIDQFRELTYAVHLKAGRVFLDVVINHTGWGSTLQENHPEWFRRADDGTFASPGAWGTIWEDLVELEHRHVELWDHLADVFLTWCRRGVDGFRCDAGYKIPTAAWQFITARVREEYPDTIFLLEGLGGAWEATESLLTDGGMQWAYSELFQNYSSLQVASYLDHGLRESQRVGLLVHYSETHDNLRLAAKGRAWSLLRNRVCALTSVSGGFGITCGVEWLAPEKINVHSCTGLAWGNPDNVLPELSQLNHLLAEHPCFFDDAKLTRLSPVDSPVYVLRRDSAEGLDGVFVIINIDVEKARTFLLVEEAYRVGGAPTVDLLSQRTLNLKLENRGIELALGPAECLCLSSSLHPRGLSGDDYRRLHAQSAWAVTALKHVLPAELIGTHDWKQLAKMVDTSPTYFLSAILHLDAKRAQADLLASITQAQELQPFPQVVTWQLRDVSRVVVVPADHWLLLQDSVPFRATLVLAGAKAPVHVESIEVREGHVACFAPNRHRGDSRLLIERYAPSQSQVTSGIRFLSTNPSLDDLQAYELSAPNAELGSPETAMVLLTNGIGGMARMCVDLGRIHSKYDCVLGANLHPSLPTDRHIFVKRIRVWANADGFITPLDAQTLDAFSLRPRAHWVFVAGAGKGQSVEIHLTAEMLDQRNTTVLRFGRPGPNLSVKDNVPDQLDVRLTVRVDIEDRNFHWETKRNSGAEAHFSSHCRPLQRQAGFECSPAPERHLRVWSDRGMYNHEAEWSENIPHPVEQSRGQTGAGDAFSPGWFDVPMNKGTTATLVLTAESVPEFILARPAINEAAWERIGPDGEVSFEQQLATSARAFLVRRGEGKTVIAGYPWFLDWGRDTLICARGYLSAGLLEEVRQLLITFGRFEENGTLPNTIHGDNASNRDTSDAPLWYGIVCEEAARAEQASNPFNLPHPILSPDPASGKMVAPLYGTIVDQRGRTIADVLRSIAAGYIHGAPNGIRMDPSSALIWSPKHFTWMDTNYPAATPREGYPVEIQVLWISLLRQLERIDTKSESETWAGLAGRAQASFEKYFWLKDRNYLADLLIAGPGRSAAEAVVDNSLRSNCLFAISLGLLTGDRAQRCAEAALRHLVIPGAIRSLAPLVVSPPLPVYGTDGRLLNNPAEPYYGKYEGDEDTRRKAAYHNGTAWTWMLPVFCEALARAWSFSPPAVTAAKAYLCSVDRLMVEGCLGQIPEILDGDAPHQQRGCDAQAWSVTEALRVWKLLNQQT